MWQIFHLVESLLTTAVEIWRLRPRGIKDSRMGKWLESWNDSERVTSQSLEWMARSDYLKLSDYTVCLFNATELHTVTHFWISAPTEGWLRQSICAMLNVIWTGVKIACKCHHQATVFVKIHPKPFKSKRIAWEDDDTFLFFLARL